MEQLSPDSHMLKHIVEVHPGEEISSIKFQARVLKYAKSAFERQITESVLIQEYKETSHILNSKSEYNRCSIPRLTTKMGEKEIREWEKTRKISKKEENEQEADVKRKIYEIRKEKMKERRSGENDTMPQKRRKLDSERFMSVMENTRGNPVHEKRYEVEEKEQPVNEKRKVEAQPVHYGG